MGAHLYLCGNKTDQCPVCQKYVRRAIFTYHVYNYCIDLDEDNTRSTSSVRGKSIGFYYLLTRESFDSIVSRGIIEL